MSDLFGDRLRPLRLICRGVGRAAVVNLLVLSLIFSLHNLRAVDPEAAGDITSAVALGTIAGQTVTALDPIGLVLIAWIGAPFGHAAWIFGDQVIEAWQAIRGESA